MRPTAAALLKDPFFKKVKDKTYLAQTVLAKLPPIWERRKPSVPKEGAGSSAALATPATGAAAGAAPAGKSMGKFGAFAAQVDKETQINN